MKKLLIIPIIVLMTASQCTMSKTVSSDQKPDKIYEVNKGEEFTIKLKANPSTGYNWSIVDGYDKSIISFVRESYKPDKVPEDRQIVGSGGTKIYIFKGVKNGETHLRLEYKRPGMKETEKEKNFKIRIK